MSFVTQNVCGFTNPHPNTILHYHIQNMFFFNLFFFLQFGEEKLQDVFFKHLSYVSTNNAWYDCESIFVI